MHLSPQERDKLLIFVAAELAQIPGVLSFARHSSRTVGANAGGDVEVAVEGTPHVLELLYS
jgi:urease gamma subunit